MSTNVVVLTGRSTKKPEISYTPNTQTACARFILAVNRPKKNGADQGADFIRIETWGKQAENCHRYMDRGSLVCVTGKIKTGSYKKQDGTTVYTTVVVANNVEFLDRSNTGDQNNAGNYGDVGNASPAPAPAPASAPAAPQQMAMEDVDSFSVQEDDIPF